MSTSPGEPVPGVDGDDAPPLPDPPQRVSGMRVPDGWQLPGKPAGLDAAAEDAWRQTGFLLGDDLRLVADDLALQAALAKTGYTPSARTMTMAGFASLWSRAFLSTSDAVGLIRRGGYQGALALLRQAIECLGAQMNLGHELDAWRRWAREAYGRDDATHATAVGVGHYFGGEAIAGDEHLRVIYRAVSDLARPNFGPAALFAAAEANHERYPLVFADQAFHLGWAQLLLGWTLRVGVIQLDAAVALPQQFPAPAELRERIAAHAGAVDAQLSARGRCHLEEVTDADGRSRHLLAEFRRRSADAPVRLLL